MKLWERITQDSLWQNLERIAIETVTAGGMAAMGYYRSAWAKQLALDEEKKNPSTLADLQATSTILRTCHTLLSPIAGRLLCGLSYFGEESTYDDYLRENLSDDVMNRKHPPQRFFESHENVLRVIFDGIDGTKNFNNGLPLFCSAAAILVDDQVRVAAIYDPMHHQVYSGVLPGPYENVEHGASAFAWQIATGNRIDLVNSSKEREQKDLKKESIGIHLTRSHPDKLDEFLGSWDPDKGSMLQRLAQSSGGIYALNSGIVAMNEIARGGLGAFVNNITNPWDVAAGEVVVRACGGKVTNFEGHPIKYASENPISVIAAKGHLHNSVKDILTG